MLRRIQTAAQYLLTAAERVFDQFFGRGLNPFYHLGALSFYFFWIVAVSGIYLYIFFETSPVNAYKATEWLTHEQWYLGGVMRSLHRYASDAMVVTVLLHLLREFTLDRLRGARWYSWVTGVVLLWFLYASGIGGYWLVWDRLAQYIAVTTTEWLDWLPLFGEPIARNFLSNEMVSDRFFALLVFLHIGIPLFLLFGMWVHIQRISRTRINPPRALALGTLATLLVLSFVHPAVSQGPADLNTIAAVVNPDWFYLLLYPLIEVWSPGAVWALVGGGTLLLTLMPWLPRPVREPAAVVDLANCNGCGRCFADCPYGAVVMQPRTDGLPFATEAVVDPALCTACGLCVAACPTATPFRRVAELKPGIDMPSLTVEELRQRTVGGATQLTGVDRVMVYGCRQSGNLTGLAGAGVAVVQVPCVGALPPSFIDLVITRRYVDGVLLAGCRPGDCYHRFGLDWTEQRLAGERDPYLRARVPRERLTVVWAGRTGRKQIEQELTALRTRLAALGPYRRGETETPANGEEEVRNAADRMG